MNDWLFSAKEMAIAACVVAVCAFCVGVNAGSSITREIAVQHGAAEWTVSKYDGSAKFQWTPKEGPK